MKLDGFTKTCLNEAYSKARVHRPSFDAFPIQTSLKQLNDPSSVIFNFALDYSNGRVQENEE
jgi:hypothetical protein